MTSRSTAGNLEGILTTIPIKPAPNETPILNGWVKPVSASVLYLATGACAYLSVRDFSERDYVSSIALGLLTALSFSTALGVYFIDKVFPPQEEDWRKKQ